MMNPRAFLYSRQQLSHSPPGPAPNSTTTTTTTTTNTTRASILARRKDDRASREDFSSLVSSSKPTSTDSSSSALKMGKRKESSDRLSPPSRSPPSTTMTAAIARPTTSSSAVQIPVKSNQETAHRQKIIRHHGDVQRRNSSSSRKSRDAHSADAIPPSVAALLAVTSIPPPNRRGSLRQRRVKENRMTVDSIVPRSQVSEKELSEELSDNSSLPSLGRSSPMDVLLSPPEGLDEDQCSMTSESGFTSTFSTRVASLESIPSLGDSLGTSIAPSMDSPVTPRGRRFRPPRRSLEPLLTPPGEEPGDPLSMKDMDQLDFRVFNQTPTSMEKKPASGAVPLRSVFKSNLTASLRALRSAARSISTFTASSIPPDDLLTRSILTIDPRVPFTDERMPPVLEEEPSEAMRRYLNPTSSMRPESPSSSPVRSYTASIQMRTYKVQRSKNPLNTANRSAPQASTSNKPPAAIISPPGPRQREMRENSEFIRIAVMEHLMRKRGKLDDQREGHARWLLPPRKSTTRPYEIGSDGVPARWIPMSRDDL